MKYIIITILIFLTQACGFLNKNSKNNYVVSKNEIINCKWAYSEDKEANLKYEITFLENGIFQSTHPNERTPDNDTWEIINNQLHFYSNNKYAHYTCTYASENILKGSSKNVKDLTWNWELRKIKK